MEPMEPNFGSDHFDDPGHPSVEQSEQQLQQQPVSDEVEGAVSAAETLSDVIEKKDDKDSDEDDAASDLSKKQKKRSKRAGPMLRAHMRGDLTAMLDPASDRSKWSMRGWWSQKAASLTDVAKRDHFQVFEYECDADLDSLTTAAAQRGDAASECDGYVSGYFQAHTSAADATPVRIDDSMAITFQAEKIDPPRPGSHTAGAALELHISAIGLNQCGHYRVRGTGTCHFETAGRLQRVDLKLVREYITEDAYDDAIAKRHMVARERAKALKEAPTQQILESPKSSGSKRHGAEAQASSPKKPKLESSSSPKKPKRPATDATDAPTVEMYLLGVAFALPEVRASERRRT
jgi:hypothetical protein